MHGRFEWGKNWIDSGTTGAFTWWANDFYGVAIREGAEQGPSRRSNDFERRAGWKEMYAQAETLALEPCADAGGRKAYKLAMKPESGDAEFWYVDAETFDVAAIDTRVPDPTGGFLAVRFVYADWRVVAGIRFPFSKTMKMGEAAFEYRYDAIDVDAPVRPEDVAPSAAVLAALKDPSKRAQAVPADPTECRVEELAAQPALSIRQTIPAGDVTKTLAIVIPEIIAAVVAVGGEMAGPPYARFHSKDATTIDFEAGVTLRKKVEGRGRVQATELPAGRTATTWHIGPYDTLPTTHARLRAWMEKEKAAAAGGEWEVYWTDPGIEPDPAKWRTRLFCPVR